MKGNTLVQPILLLHFYNLLLKLVFLNNRRLFFYSLVSTWKIKLMLITRGGVCLLNLICSILEIYISMFLQYCLLIFK